MTQADEADGGGGRIRLTTAGPARGGPLVDFLATRAIPGLEAAGGGRFRRNLPQGWIELAPDDDPGAAWLDVHFGVDQPGPAGFDAEAVTAIVRRVADLDTDLDPVADHLSADPELSRRIASVGMARLPGTFDPFELAIRAVMGQQVTVAAARTLLGRLVALAAGPGGATTTVRAFPSPEAIAACDLDQLGMPRSRRATIATLARAVAGGEVDLGPGVETDELTRQLVALPGVGPWTAGYIAMRVGPDPDGWPRGDLVLRQSLDLSAPELERRAERWRPYRAYAALLLWRTAPVPVRRTRRPAPMKGCAP